ncbi:hypothetical protein STEG23_026292 [Scotinomys teguina]
MHQAKTNQLIRKYEAQTPNTLEKPQLFLVLLSVPSESLNFIWSLSPGQQRSLRGSPFLPVIANNQRSPLEDRLNNQERTIAFLLQQAFRIKEDLSACLQGAQGFQKEESLARKLLESHIQTITSIVKKLNQNIEAFPSDFWRCFRIMSPGGQFSGKGFGECTSGKFKHL